MIVGDPHTFAIESEITAIFPDRDNAALGFFVIHVGGKCFGVKEADATMLGNSYGEVEQRLLRLGTHEMPLLEEVDAVDIAKVYLHALWRDAPVADCLGVTKQEFVVRIYSNNVI